MHVHAKDAECRGVPSATVYYKDREIGPTNGSGIFTHTTFEPLAVGESFEFELLHEGLGLSAVTDPIVVQNKKLDYEVDALFVAEGETPCGGGVVMPGPDPEIYAGGSSQGGGGNNLVQNSPPVIDPDPGPVVVVDPGPSSSTNDNEQVEEAEEQVTLEILLGGVG